MKQKAITLVCPFCDEPADLKYRCKRIVTPHKIYTPRECIMGHQFYSVESVPEDQSAIVDEVKEIKAYEREQRKLRKVVG